MRKNLFPSITLAVLLGGYGLRVVLRDRRENYQLQKEQIIKDKKFFETLPKLLTDPKLYSRLLLQIISIGFILLRV